MTPYGVIPYEPVEAGVIKHMTGADAKVYLAICAHVRAKTWAPAMPSQARLADLCGLTERAVRAALRRLEKRGLLVVHPGCGKHHLSTYQLTGNPERPFRLCDGETRNGGAPNPERRRTKPGTPVPRHNDEEQKLKNRPKNIAAKRPPPASTTPNNGALVAMFVDLFGAKVGEPFTGNRPKLAGNLSRLANVHGPDVVQARITRWFAATRPDYGPELFILRFQSTELRGTPGKPAGRGGPSTFTGADAGGTDYDALAQHF